MAIATTTPRDIRAALATAIASLNADSSLDTDDQWIYIDNAEEGSSGKRVFAIIQDPSTHEWAPAGSALMGDSATTDWNYTLTVEVGYIGLPTDEADDMAMDDHRALWQLFHPQGTTGALAAVNFAAAGDGPRIQSEGEYVDGGPVYHFQFRVHYKGEHNPNT